MADSRSGLTTAEQIDEMRRELERASTPARRRLARLKGAAGTVLSFVFVLFVMAVVFTLLQVWAVREQGKTPGMLGYYFYEVTATDLEPFLSPGSVVLAKTPRENAILQPGDIVTFLTDENQLETRVVADSFIGEDGVIAYHTRGAAESAPPDDEALSRDRVQFMILGPLPFFG